MQLTASQNDYIQNCIQKEILSKDAKLFEVFYFGSTKSSSQYLYELVKNGTKTATSSAYDAFIDGEIPKQGDISLITSYEGDPLALIQTTDVLVTQFNMLTYDQIKDEGEDDHIESWRIHHQDFFERDGKRNNYSFSEDMRIVFEHFKAIDIK